MKRLRRKVAPGELRPRFYGFAYFDPVTAFDIFYPIPLNWLIALGRRIRWFLKSPVMKAEADVRAWHAGFKEGRAMEVNHIEARVKRLVESQLHNAERIVREKIEKAGSMQQFCSVHGANYVVECEACVHAADKSGIEIFNIKEKTDVTE